MISTEKVEVDDADELDFAGILPFSVELWCLPTVTEYCELFRKSNNATVDESGYWLTVGNTSGGWT